MAAGVGQGGGRRVQSRTGSLGEALTNVVVGYLLSLLTQAIVYPLFGIAASAGTDLTIAAIFTVVSLGRSYLLRRAFEPARPAPFLHPCRDCAFEEDV